MCTMMMTLWWKILICSLVLCLQHTLKRFSRLYGQAQNSSRPAWEATAVMQNGMLPAKQYSLLWRMKLKDLIHALALMHSGYGLSNTMEWYKTQWGDTTACIRWGWIIGQECSIGNSWLLWKWLAWIPTYWMHSVDFFFDQLVKFLRTIQYCSHEASSSDIHYHYQSFCFLNTNSLAHWIIMIESMKLFTIFPYILSSNTINHSQLKSWFN